MTTHQQALPTRTTGSTQNEDDAVPDIDTTETSGLLQERLQAYKHACGYLEVSSPQILGAHRRQF